MARRTSLPGWAVIDLTTGDNGTLQNQNASAIMPEMVMLEHRRELEKLERQMIPLLNTIRKELGKPPIIVPK